MTPIIQQSVRFSCSPKQLFELYMDSAKHTAVTGQPAKLSRRAGGAFTAFGGLLRGKNLVIAPNRLIVQAWRSQGFKRTDPDSILILEFSKAGGGSQVELVHINVPIQDHKGVTGGWAKYYWEPWTAYLAGRGGKSKGRA